MIDLLEAGKRARLCLAFAAVMAVSFAAPVLAQTAAPAASTPISVGDAYSVRSTVLDEDRRIMVHLPSGYEQSGRSYPVLYLLDPEAHFLHVSAAVDFLGTKPFVDRERIGVIGVCGSGSFGLAAAETDSRIKAVATVSMYDIGQAHRQGLAEAPDTAAVKKSVAEISKLRWAEVDGAERAMAIGTPQALTESSSAIDKEFFDYYRTPRGQHPRSSTAFWRTGGAQMMLFWSLANLEWISPRPILFITGDHAHSRIFSEQAFKKASQPKELHVVPNAGHVDLYDRVELIPFEKLTAFFSEHLR